jgi:hypothetical protein
MTDSINVSRVLKSPSDPVHYLFDGCNKGHVACVLIIVKMSHIFTIIEAICYIALVRSTLQVRYKSVHNH